MGHSVRAVEYFYATVRDQPGEAFQALAALADAGVSLLALTALPLGPGAAQLQLFPEDPEPLLRYAARSGLVLTGPQRAFLVQGDDRIGALVELHRELADVGVNVYASSGVTDGRGRYGYLVYVRPEEFDRAARVLGA